MASFLHARATQGHARYALFTPSRPGLAVADLAQGRYVYTGLLDHIADFDEDLAAPLQTGHIRIALNSGQVEFGTATGPALTDLAEVVGFKRHIGELLAERFAQVEIRIEAGPERAIAEQAVRASVLPRGADLDVVALGLLDGRPMRATIPELRTLLVQTLVLCGQPWHHARETGWQLRHHASPIAFTDAIARITCRL